MENRLKERLTGAAILVALIVLLVPEMFRGQRGEVATTASSGEGLPVRSYTIDLSNGPARTAPLESTPAAAAAAPVASDSGAESPAAPAPSAPSASSAPAVTPVAAGNAAAHGAHSAPARSASTGSAVATAPISHPSSGGTWSVQLGLFAQHDNAERLLHSVQSKGFPASVSEHDAKGLYHVEVGNLSDRAAAQALQARLRDQGFPAAVMPPPSAAVKAH